MTRERRGVLVRVLILALVIAAGAALMLGASTLQRARHHYRSAQLSLAQLETVLAGSGTGTLDLLRDPVQLATIQAALDTLDKDLAALERLARPFLPLSARLGWLPGVGGDLEAAPHLVALARSSVDAAQSLSQGLAPLVERVHQPEAGVHQLMPQIVRTLTEARSDLESAQLSLERAREARAAVDPARLSGRTSELLGRFDRFLEPAEDGLAALRMLPQLLGSDGKRSYLLVAQNNQELRPTGGFISGVGLLQLEGGEIANLSFQDSYTVDDLDQPHPPPPAPLRRLMKAGMLLLRDANWWPDFPTSAGAMASLFRQDQGIRVDGVIAVDLTTLDLLLQAIGPVQVPGYDEPVGTDNLQAMMMSYWQAPVSSAPGKEGTDWWLHRKDFASDLLAALLLHLMQDVTPDDLANLAWSVGRALSERHLLIYVQDSQAGSSLSTMGWDGALKPYDGDYLMVVDSNVGFNKVNPNVEQTIDYRVEVDGRGQTAATLTLTYRHLVQKPMPACIHESRYGDSYRDLLERCYWDYVRVYIPAGSKVEAVLGTDGDVEIYEEAGRTVIAVFFLLETGQARRIEINYKPNVANAVSGYRLLVQKQAGTDARLIRTQVQPPAGVRLMDVTPEGWAWADEALVWQGLLERDWEVGVSWE